MIGGMIWPPVDAAASIFAPGVLLVVADLYFISGHTRGDGERPPVAHHVAGRFVPLIMPIRP